MAIVDATGMLLEATAGNYAVGAFNITNIIQMEAVIEAAVDMRSPLILQTSVTPSKLIGRQVIVAVYQALARSAPIPICLHLDHCTDLEYAKLCADAGYTSIMIDGSRHGFADNIKVTREVADYCHQLGGVSVEGELGTVSGVEDQIRVAADEAALCNPDQAVEYVERTQIDLFAPAIGTAHGHYQTADPIVDFERLGEIRTVLDSSGLDVPLVVHGGSGLPGTTVRRLIEVGGAKFNVSTDLKHALIDATFDYISAHRDEYNPGKVDLAVKDAIRSTVCKWIELLGSAGQA